MVGFGAIGVGLAILLVALLWSAARRLRDLPDDPRILRGMIIAGLIVCALGVVLGAVSVGIR